MVGIVGSRKERENKEKEETHLNQTSFLVK